MSPGNVWGSLGTEKIAIAPGSTFSPETGTSAAFTRLFIIFATAHLFFDPAPFHQLPKPPHRLLNGFLVSNVELYHNFSLDFGKIRTNASRIIHLHLFIETERGLEHRIMPQATFSVQIGECVAIQFFTMKGLVKYGQFGKSR